MAISPAPSSPSSPRLLLVDGHAQAYRAYHAIRRLHSPAGAPTNAIYGFIKALGRFRSSVQPTHLQVVWDGGLAAERRAALPAYKAQRPPMPADLGTQIEELQRYLAVARLSSFCQPDVEADDWIATLAAWAVGGGAEVVIVSSDKDFLQLLGPRVGLLNPQDPTPSIWRGEQVVAKTGVEPGQVVDWLSLVGDTVDNIEGVAGVGRKKAAGLLRQFGSVEGLYGRLGEVAPARLQASLRTAEPVVRRNQALIRLKADLPFERGWEALALPAEDLPRLRPLYEEWGFHSLAAAAAPVSSAQGEFW